ncbi:DNA-binding response regulator [Roseovarius sp. TE539]|uniref:winged helix-turn-helix domain-containing protein n=1 Tax=Roseovarius sp. TE539 TaxID=2249812 RepID=UPI000DDE0551|nr:response regulator transcription factor [Roseovarius sp. TE539]RBI70521.1 DNA-binding response regulator [Roseovarius sp. TE539]
MTRPSVLVLDDEDQIAKLVDTALSEDGCDVCTVGKISDFREKQAEQDFDIYIIDLGLPDGNGLSLIQELSRNPACGVIILSGREADTDRIVGLEIGADDYITKPFKLRELVARVHAVLRRTQKQPIAQQEVARDMNSTTGTTSAIQFDDYRLDLGARLLFAPDGGEIELTTAEFNLLAALLNRRGQVLSRDQLMNAVKGRDWESYDRAIDSLVSRLRQKIPAPRDRSHYIRTVHGVGYAFSLSAKDSTRNHES